jgi:GMP synthase-like glutamine amidotransferase
VSLFNASRNRAKILVVQNSVHAPGGNFTRGLAARGARLAVVSPVKDDDLPSTADAFDGLVVLGGPQHAFDDQAGPYFGRLIQLMRHFDSQEKPVAGICLGSQLLARAHGGRPFPLNTLEFGFVQHRLTLEGAQDPLLRGLELPALMEFHEDTFSLPLEATLLIEGDGCRNQCFRVGHASYGFQPHLEVEGKTARNWIEMFVKGEIETFVKYRQNFDEPYMKRLLDNLDHLIAEAARYCDRVAENWLALTRRKHIFRLTARQRPLSDRQQGNSGFP